MLYRTLPEMANGSCGLPGPEGLSELEMAKTPNLDQLAAESVCGVTQPVLPGITPGSGPGHLTKPDGFLLYNGEGVALWESGNLGGRTRIVAITPGEHGIITATYLEEQQQIVLHRWSRA